MTATHQTVVDFFCALYKSDRRDLADWLGVKRSGPVESDVDFGKRVLATAKELGKLDELAAKVDEMKKRHS